MAFISSSWWAYTSWKHVRLMNTCLHPHLYIGKTGVYTGYTFFSYFCSKRSMFWAKIRKISHFFIWKLQFLKTVKYCSILHGHVCVIRYTHGPASVFRPSSVHIFKDLLRRNRSANQSQISCGASLGRGNESSSRHSGHMTKLAATLIYGTTPSKIFFSGTDGPISTKLGMWRRELKPIIVCSKWWPWVDLNRIYGKVKFGNMGFSTAKSEKSGIFRNYCNLWHESW